jgi:hypothetical protein
MSIFKCDKADLALLQQNQRLYVSMNESVIYAPHHADIWGSGGVPPYILISALDGVE